MAPIVPGGAEVHVWRVTIDVLGAGHERLLSREERARAARFGEVHQRIRYTVAHVALRTILAHYLDMAPEAVRFTAGDDGKPRVANAARRGVHFNLSRSGDLALCALGGREVGVDVERLDARRDVVALALRAFGPAEVARLRNLPPASRVRAFHERWVVAEAIAKREGVGLAGIGRGPTATVATAMLDAGPGYVGAVASAGSRARVRTFDLSARMIESAFESG